MSQSTLKDKDSRWPWFGFRLVISTVTHPIEYAKLLIQVRWIMFGNIDRFVTPFELLPCYFFQIGHEPIPPRPTTTLFGKPALSLPNIFQYSKEYIANNLFFS